MAVHAPRSVVSPPGNPPSFWLRHFRRLFPIAHGPREIPALDGLRAIAVGLVFLYHTWGSSPALFHVFGARDLRGVSTFGQMGVLLFFVLSGFLLFLPYARALHTGGPLPNTLTFYRRRALRILPAYWASVLLMAYLVKPELLQVSQLWQVVSHLLFVFPFTTETLHGINGVYWTLGIEVHFYLLLPFFVAAVARVGRAIGPGRALALGIGLVCLLSAVWRVLFGEVLTLSIDYRFFFKQSPALLFVFALGLGCSYLYSVYGLRIPDRVRLLATLGGVAGLLLLLDAAGIWRTPSYLDRSVVSPTAGGVTFYTLGSDWDIVVTLAWCGVVLAAVFGHRLWATVFGLWPLRALSLVSYSFYLWHAIIIGEVSPQWYAQHKGPTASLSLCLVAFVLAFGFALGLYHFVEAPFLRAKNQATNPPPP